MDYGWPGNVRELENAIERAVVLSAHPVITADLFPEDIVSRGDTLPLIASKPDASLFEIVEDCERRVITLCWNAADGTRPRPPNASTCRSPR